jgi:hypothetical protein
MPRRGRRSVGPSTCVMYELQRGLHFGHILVALGASCFIARLIFDWNIYILWLGNLSYEPTAGPSRAVGVALAISRVVAGDTSSESCSEPLSYHFLQQPRRRLFSHVGFHLPEIL